MIRESAGKPSPRPLEQTAVELAQRHACLRLKRRANKFSEHIQNHWTGEQVRATDYFQHQKGKTQVNPNALPDPFKAISMQGVAGYLQVHFNQKIDPNAVKRALAEHPELKANLNPLTRQNAQGTNAITHTVENGARLQIITIRDNHLTLRVGIQSKHFPTAVRVVEHICGANPFKHLTQNPFPSP